MNLDLIDELVETYIKEELPIVRKNLLLLQQKNAFPDFILKGRAESAKQEFSNKAVTIAPLLSNCTSIEDIYDVCEATFSQIKGIGERTISKYVYNYAYTHDIDPEASCSMCFLTTAAKATLNRIGCIVGNKLNIAKMGNSVKELTLMERIIFLNNNHILLGEDIINE